MAVSDQPNSLPVTDAKSENFIVDVVRLAHNSKQKLQRSLSRKTNPTNDSEGESKIVPLASPTATLGGDTMLEKPNAGPVDWAPALAHHQITIKTNINGGSSTESRSPSTRPSFRRSQPSWGFDPRKVFVFMASLSSMGTILLIYFTLSVGNPSEDDIAHNW